MKGFYNFNKSLQRGKNPNRRILKKRKIKRILPFLLRSIAGLIVLSAAMVLLLRWIPPFTSAFMIERSFLKAINQETKSPTRYHWINLKAISPNILLAVIAAEDQKFYSHWGFDFESIAEAIEDSQNGASLRGASTITQQVAKNLFLWSGRSFVRKAVEAYFTVILEIMWPKKRILEVYVNIAEFGNGIYGVYEASEKFYKKKPVDLTKREASLLAAALPNPARFKVQNPSYYVQRRARWIEVQMVKLGGISYIENVCGKITSGK